jgi:hypothetical protein
MRRHRQTHRRVITIPQLHSHLTGLPSADDGTPYQRSRTVGRKRHQALRTGLPGEGGAL